MAQTAFFKARLKFCTTKKIFAYFYFLNIKSGFDIAYSSFWLCRSHFEFPLQRCSQQPVANENTSTNGVAEKSDRNGRVDLQGKAATYDGFIKNSVFSRSFFTLLISTF